VQCYENLWQTLNLQSKLKQLDPQTNILWTQLFSEAYNWKRMQVNSVYSLSRTDVHCDHTVHFSADSSLWLDSPMFRAPWHQSMSTYSQPSFSSSSSKRGRGYGWMQTRRDISRTVEDRGLSYYWVIYSASIGTTMDNLESPWMAVAHHPHRALSLRKLSFLVSPE